MKYSVRITHAHNGNFVAYLSHRGRTAWSKRQAQRHIAEAKDYEHFKGCNFTLEPEMNITPL